MTVHSQKGAALRGRVQVPGDKSISHRALLLGAMANGVTTITGLLEGDDVLRTAAALRALGALVEKDGAVWVVTGRTWQTPCRTLYAGNAGTGARLLMGAVAGQGVKATFDGDASLRARPMGRVLDPLAQMGLDYSDHEGHLPVTLNKADLTGITYRLPKPSAQVKSALLLAGLGAQGTTMIEEPVLCRDHTERMLAAFGVELEITAIGNEGRRIALAGGQSLRATDVIVPADPSSAAFPVVAGLITPGSDIIVEGVLMNPQRTGLYQTLIEMGGDLSFENEREAGGEQLADIHVRGSSLKGVVVPATRAPSMIDEYPILAVAAAAAEGTTRMEGLEELRVKESDRLAAVAAGLAANGVAHEVGEDWLAVIGGQVAGGGIVRTHMDHRIAMSFLILGLISDKPIGVDSGEMIATSFPDFISIMQRLGASMG